MVGQYRFVYLLAALVGLLLTAPLVGLMVAHEEGNAPRILPRIIMSSVFSAIFLTAVFAVARHRISLIAGGLLAGLTILVECLLLLGFDSLLEAKYVLGIIFLGFTLALIIRHLFGSDDVTVDTICASLCAFLVMGILWALVYSLVDILHPNSFSRVLCSRLYDDDPSTSLYFSLVTLTTLGYGDITPVKPVARSLSALEAVTGQIYLVVLVARLVGLHIAHSRDGRSDRSD